KAFSTSCRRDTEPDLFSQPLQSCVGGLASLLWGTRDRPSGAAPPRAEGDPMPLVGWVMVGMVVVTVLVAIAVAYGDRRHACSSRSEDRRQMLERRTRGPMGRRR